jgi:hypothetical protein
MEPLGRPPEVELLSDGYEVPQMPKFHGTMFAHGIAVVVGSQAALFDGVPGVRARA